MIGLHGHQAPQKCHIRVNCISNYTFYIFLLIHCIRKTDSASTEKRLYMGADATHRSAFRDCPLQAYLL